MKIKAAVLYEQGKKTPFSESKPLKVEEVDLEPPGAGEVLIRTGAAGLCHSDLSMINGVMQRKVPMVPGHEAAGVVEEIGANVTQCKPGDHVVMSFVPICGECEFCITGRSNICSTAFNARATGALINGNRRLSLNGEPLHHTNGVSCYAEYMVACEDSVITIDKEVPMLDAALFGCAVVTGVGAIINTAKIVPGSTIAVVGLGGVGLCALLGGVVAGAGRIIAVDIASDKLGLARQLGATDTFNATDPNCTEKIIEETKGGVEYAFEVAGVVEAMQTAYAITRRGGTTVTSGLSQHQHTFEIPHSQLVVDERTIKGSYMGSCVVRNDVPKFINLYKQGKLPVDKLRSGNICLNDLNQGFDKLAAGDAIRQMLVMHDEFSA
ncbi:MAG: putative alcohol dehydrogenase D [Alphaproteobacteria bacterium MarineAlpha3_Bin6]|nr:alcohol dehydrogenase [Rhodospirillaceae bacterium]PPR58713.1 MAG: putative alcohol dehydrogenase D [Alphaproteobacteria bacterium MarineAlpha3_Bin6]HIC60461.1 alcohol dehydrogenase [Rhodospirillales bacterium]|tara:strand:+ start:730 stop:1872 length:1143 start_codon:yes stop_codon:yes gene_type:complete